MHEAWTASIDFVQQNIEHCRLEVDKHRHMLKQRRQEIEEHKKVLKQRRQEIEEHKQEIEKHKQEIEKQRKVLKQRKLKIEKLDNFNNRLSGQVDAMCKSYSWRITAPLRWTFSKLQKNRKL